MLLQKQSFGILLCSVEFLLRSVGFGEHGSLAFEQDDRGDEGKSSCNNKLREVVKHSMINEVITFENTSKLPKRCKRETATLTSQKRTSVLNNRGQN